MTAQRLIVLAGLPGSTKSTLADRPRRANFMRWISALPPRSAAPLTLILPL
jgi:hypothetical protein